MVGTLTGHVRIPLPVPLNYSFNVGQPFLEVFQSHDRFLREVSFTIS